MATTLQDNPLGARATLKTRVGGVEIYALRKLADAGLCDLDRMPYCIRVLLENVLRHAGGGIVTKDDVVGLAGWNAKAMHDASAVTAPWWVFTKAIKSFNADAPSKLNQCAASPFPVPPAAALQYCAENRAQRTALAAALINFCRCSRTSGSSIR